MKTIFFLFSMMLLGFGTRSQRTDQSLQLLLKLDSVSKSSSVSRHFAGIYYETIIGTINFFSNRSERMQELIGRLEVRFADYFFRSADAYSYNRPVHEVWKDYYADTTGAPLRYILYGINAHINGDIWQALTAEFSAAELEELKPGYFAYQKQLIKNYRDFYADALQSNRKMRTVHAASFGFDKIYGKILLGRWRKRQMKLAELYFNDPALFEIRRSVLQRKMERLNNLIRKNI